MIDGETINWIYGNQKNSIGKKLNDFKILCQLGVGASSIVFKVQSLYNNKVYVLKRTKLKENLDSEVQLLKRLDYKHIIKYFGSFVEDDHFNILMEYAEFGDLLNYMKSFKIQKIFIKEEEIWFFAYQILLGLDYLHSNNIIHRDIKLLNIFLNKDKMIKIGDLGVSLLFNKKDKNKFSRVGTPLFLAPEVIKQLPCDYKIDIWSLGCSLYHLATFEPPFNDKDLSILSQQIIENEPNPIDNFYSQKLRDFIFVLLSKNPSIRLSAKEGLNIIPDQIKKNYKKIFEQILNNFKPYKTNSFFQSYTNNKLYQNNGKVIDKALSRNVIKMEPILVIDRNTTIEQNTIINNFTEYKTKTSTNELITIPRVTLKVDKKYSKLYLKPAKFSEMKSEFLEKFQPHNTHYINPLNRFYNTSATLKSSVKGFNTFRNSEDKNSISSFRANCDNVNDYKQKSFTPNSSKSNPITQRLIYINDNLLNTSNKKRKILEQFNSLEMKDKSNKLEKILRLK